MVFFTKRTLSITLLIIENLKEHLNLKLNLEQVTKVGVKFRAKHLHLKTKKVKKNLIACTLMYIVWHILRVTKRNDHCRGYFDNF